MEEPEMKLVEFNTPDYSHMSEEELNVIFAEGLLKLEKAIDKSNEEIENGFRLKNTNNLHKISSS